MRRIQTYLDTKTADSLVEFAEQKGLSLSTAAGDILREHFERTLVDEISPLDAETKSYFLQIIGTLNQVLMCVYDKDKVDLKVESAQVCIQKITGQIQALIEKDRVISQVHQ